jgi:hypothetical protein
MDALMAEVIEGHIRFHVLDPDSRPTEDGRRPDSRSAGVPQMTEQFANCDDPVATIR